MKLSLDNLKISISDSFRSEWGSGRKHVNADLYESTKRSLEERIKLPLLRADEPVNDSYRVPLSRQFRYCFQGLLSKKRPIEKIADSSYAK